MYYKKGGLKIIPVSPM